MRKHGPAGAFLRRKMRRKRGRTQTEWRQGRGFAVGAPARRRRDGNGKIAVRGGEAMAAKRTTAQGGFAQRNAAPAFARQTQKVGPVTGYADFCAAKTELKTRRRAYERENCKKRRQQNSGAGRRSRGREADGRTGGSRAAKCRARACAASPKGGRAARARPGLAAAGRGRRGAGAALPRAGR